MTIPTPPARGADWEAWMLAVDTAARAVAGKADVSSMVTAVTTVAAAGASRALVSGYNRLTLTAASCALTMPSATAGTLSQVIVELKQDSTGGRLVTFPSSVLWPTGSAPVLSTGANKTDVLSLMSPDGGTTWLGSMIGSSYTAPSAPSAPTGLAASPGNALVGLTWAAPVGASPAVTGYRIYRATTANVTTSSTLLATVGNVLAHTDNTAANGTTYYYRVMALNGVSDGTGALSNEASATPVAANSLPTTTTAPTQWFKADALALADGAAVATWTDSSTTAVNATQATVANQPTFKTSIVAGKPVVRFDGSGDRLVSTATWVEGWTVFAVMKQGTTGGNYHVIGSPSGGYTVRVNATAKLEVVKTSTTGVTVGTASVPNPSTSFNVLAVSLAVGNGSSARNAKLSINGAVETTTPNIYMTAGAKTIVVGANDDSTAALLNGDLAELLFYPAELSDTDRRAVESYLGTKYGITVV